MAASTYSSTMPARMSSTSRSPCPTTSGSAASSSTSKRPGSAPRPCCRRCWRKGAGAIVNIASCHAFKIIPHTFPYPVAKHALVGLTRSLGIEYAARGIRVNAIAPGYIETPIAEAYWNTFADPAAERRRAYDLHPPKRIGRPEEVAMTAVFLASDEAPFINAETITIDGGRSVLYHD